MTRGVAPLILGYQKFDENINLAGVILNQVGGPRHESKLRAAIERYTTVPVLGAIHRDSRLNIEERHLGLIPSNEVQEVHSKIRTVAELVAEQVNLTQLLEIANPKELEDTVKPDSSIKPDRSKRTVRFDPSIKPDRSKRTVRFDSVKIGIIRDAAFGFYYPGDLIALEETGAELVFIDALQDAQLPEVNGLFIGGGFPEENMEALFNNQSLRNEIKVAVEQGLPVYAECGGLMYLSRQITWQGKTFQMVGALPCDTVMESRPQGRGYVHLRETGQGLWPLLNAQGQPAEFYAHEFHYSRIVNLPSHLPFAYEVLRGEGLDGHHDGLVYKNTLASYVHLRDVEGNRWTQRFVEFVRKRIYSNILPPLYYS
jgi:cobyrinic acid a,c-diamide synthase